MRALGDPAGLIEPIRRELRASRVRPGAFRTHATRMALGAHPADLMRLVLGETVVLVLMGLAAGTGIALAATAPIESFLFNVKRTGPAMTAIVAGLLMAVALLAARAGPLSALRHE